MKKQEWCISISIGVCDGTGRDAVAFEIPTRKLAEIHEKNIRELASRALWGDPDADILDAARAVREAAVGAEEEVSG